MSGSAWSTICPRWFGRPISLTSNYTLRWLAIEILTAPPPWSSISILDQALTSSTAGPWPCGFENSWRTTAWNVSPRRAAQKVCKFIRPSIPPSRLPKRKTLPAPWRNASPNSTPTKLWCRCNEASVRTRCSSTGARTIIIRPLCASIRQGAADRFLAPAMERSGQSAHGGEASVVRHGRGVAARGELWRLIPPGIGPQTEAAQESVSASSRLTF
jgi:hypothetical protein